MPISFSNTLSSFFVGCPVREKDNELGAEFPFISSAITSIVIFPSIKADKSNLPLYPSSPSVLVTI